MANQTETSMRIGDLPLEVQMRQQFQTLHRLIINFLLVVREPTADILVAKRAFFIDDTPSLPDKEQGKDVSYMLSRDEMSKMLQSAKTWPDPFLMETSEAIYDAAEHLVKLVLELPEDFV